MNEIQIHQNKGAILLVFVLITTIIGSALLLKALNLGTASSAQTHDADVLLKAKLALKGYAVSYGDKNPNNLPGYLPCPDIDGDGVADMPCGLTNQSAMGRLPWQSLGLSPLRDSAGECLWYAVSGAYKESPKGSLSTNASGQFLLFDVNLNSLNGTDNKETAIAVVFSTGKPLSLQNRSLSTVNATECGSTLSTDRVRRSSEYFEGFSAINNANGSYTPGTISGLTISAIPTNNFSTFISSDQLSIEVPASINDKMIKISAIDFTEVYQYMQQTIGRRVRQCLNSYASSNAGKLPWPAILEPPGSPSYTDNTVQERFGRIASNLINTQADGYDMLWPMDPVQPSVRCFNWSWWPAVKESVFIAIDKSVSPIGMPGLPTLTIDTVNTSATILIAGRENDSQNRTDGIQRGTISNYLESSNVIDSGTGSLPPGDENFVSSDIANTDFNDYVCTLSLCP